MDDWYEPTEFDKEDDDDRLPMSVYRHIEEHVVRVYESIREYTRTNEPLLLKYMEVEHVARFLYGTSYLERIASSEEGPRLF